MNREVIVDYNIERNGEACVSTASVSLLDNELIFTYNSLRTSSPKEAPFIVLHSCFVMVFVAARFTGIA